MSEETKAAQPQLNPDQQRAIIVKFMQTLHQDLGMITRALVANPTDNGYHIPSDMGHEAITRLTRGRAALEKLLKASGAQVPQTGTAATAKDGAMIATFVPAPAAPLRDLSGAFSTDAIGGANLTDVAANISQMSVGLVEGMKQRTTDLIDKHTAGREQQ